MKRILIATAIVTLIYGSAFASNTETPQMAGQHFSRGERETKRPRSIEVYR